MFCCGLLGTVKYVVALAGMGDGTTEGCDYIIVEAGIQEAGSRVDLEVKGHYERNGQ